MSLDNLVRSVRYPTLRRNINQSATSTRAFTLNHSHHAGLWDRIPTVRRCADRTRDCRASSSPTGGARRAAMKLDRVGVARRNQLLQCLAPADFDLLAPHLKDVSLHQGDILAEPAALVENVYFPHTAVISLLAVMRDGQTVETATVGRAGVVGGVSGFGPWRAFARMIVQVPGTAARIPSAFSKSSRLRHVMPCTTSSSACVVGCCSRRITRTRMSFR